MADDPNVVTVKTMAEFIGKSVRQCQYLQQNGVLIKNAKGKYLFKESLKSLIQDYESKDSKNDIDSARLDKTQRETELLELRIAKEAGELIDAAEAQAGLASYVVGVNKLIEGLRGNIVRTWPEMPMEAQATVDKMVLEAKEQGKRVRLTIDVEDDDE